MNETTIPLFVTIGTALDGATATFVIDTVNRMIAIITPWTVGLVTIWLFFYGYSIMAGRINKPMEEGIIYCARIVIITTLALNTGVYLQWVVQTIQAFQEALVGIVTGRENVSLWESIDGTLDSGYKLFELCMIKGSDAGFMHLGPLIAWWLAGLMIILSFGLIVLGGGASILVATLLLRILFATGPIFLLCLIWQSSRGFFDNWLGACITYLTQIVVVAAMLAVSIHIFESIANSIDLTAAGDQSVMRVVLFLFGAGLLLSICMGECARLAGTLGNKIGAEMLSAAGVAHSAMAPARTARQVLNPRSSKLDPSTGHKIEASRIAHVVSGRTVANPVYRQVLIRKMQSGWK